MTKIQLILAFLCLTFCACNVSKKITGNQENAIKMPSVDSLNNAVNVTYHSIDLNELLKEKYAKYLNVSPDNITNYKLYRFIDKWLNTPYKWGGKDEKGIDCSAFIQRLLNEVYDLKIPRTSIQQLLTYRIEPFKSTKFLSEGDILFFRTMKDKIVSHVGIYLQNNMFINSSSSRGVSIANLRSDYWRQRFVVAGRVRVLLARK